MEKFVAICCGFGRGLNMKSKFRRMNDVGKSFDRYSTLYKSGNAIEIYFPLVADNFFHMRDSSNLQAFAFSLDFQD